MNENHEWINLLILFGGLNALIFSIILCFQRKHPGVKFLAAYFFVLAYNGLETFNWSAGLYYTFFDLLPFIVIFAAGPSLYLYIRSLLNPELRITSREIVLHYGVMIFQFVSRFIVLGYHFLAINKMVTGTWAGKAFGIIMMYSEPLSVLVFVAYLGLSVRAFLSTRPNLLKEKDVPRVTWITAFLVSNAVFAIAWVCTVAALFLFPDVGDSTYYPIELGLVLFTYWMVLNGYHKVKVLQVKPGATPRVADLKSQQDFERIRAAMETDKLFLDPELNLAKVSSHIGLPSKSISALLNQYNRTGFSDFVNSYRVAEVSDRMLDPNNKHFTISALALESGFNSQATFQRAFRNVTGMSPRDFLQRHQRKIA